MSEFVARLLAVGPHGGAHRTALRVSVSVLVPLLVLDLTGHTLWSLYAAFGAFTAVFGRDRINRHRLVLQGQAAAALVACVALGSVVGLSPHRAWVAVPIAAAIAWLASYASIVTGWHPPGALFPVFAFAAVASVPSQPHTIAVAAGVAAASAAFAIAVGGVGGMLRRTRWMPRLIAERPIGGSRQGARGYAATAAIGVLVAGSIATGVGIGRPYWAMVAAAVPLAARGPILQLVRGVHRIVGTGLGLLLAWVLLGIELHGVVLVLVLAALQACGELLVARNYALALLFVTPMALGMVSMAVPTPTHTIIAERGLETLIGAAVGIVVGYLLRPRRSLRHPLAGRR